MMTCILLSYASLLTPRNAQRKTNAEELTTVLSVYTTKISIRLNSVTVIPIKYNNVNMAITVLLLILLKTSRSD